MGRQAVGRSRGLHSVHLPGPELPVGITAPGDLRMPALRELPWPRSTFQGKPGCCGLQGPLSPQGGRHGAPHTRAAAAPGCGSFLSSWAHGFLVSWQRRKAGSAQQTGRGPGRDRPRRVGHPVPQPSQSALLPLTTGSHAWSRASCSCLRRGLHLVAGQSLHPGPCLMLVLQPGGAQRGGLGSVAPAQGPALLALLFRMAPCHRSFQCVRRCQKSGL